MESVTLGQSGLQVSALCLGTDAIGSKLDEATSYQMLDVYYDQGGRFIDTANFYASWLPGCRGGESETTIGQWIKARGVRDQVVIDSKLAFDYPGCAGGLSAVEIERECEKSLRRLQTDRIDLYYSHRDDQQTPLQETMEAFDRLLQAGKVRAIGASNLPCWRIAEANMISLLSEWSLYTVIQQRHTYLRPRYGADFGPQVCLNDDLKSFAQSRDIALVGYATLLQGAYTREDRPLPPQYQGPDADQRLVTLRQIADEVDATVNQVVIAWMRQSRPAVLPIIAGSRPEQLIENIDALKVKLSSEQMEKLDAAGNPNIEQAWIR